MADMPDLSHLTPEERAIIEGVMMRQRQEEQREHEIMRCARRRLTPYLPRNPVPSRIAISFLPCNAPFADVIVSN